MDHNPQLAESSVQPAIPQVVIHDTLVTPLIGSDDDLRVGASQELKLAVDEQGRFVAATAMRVTDGQLMRRVERIWDDERDAYTEWWRDSFDRILFHKRVERTDDGGYIIATEDTPVASESEQKTYVVEVASSSASRTLYRVRMLNDPNYRCYVNRGSGGKLLAVITDGQLFSYKYNDDRLISFEQPSAPPITAPDIYTVFDKSTSDYTVATTRTNIENLPVTTAVRAYGYDALGRLVTARVEELDTSGLLVESSRTTFRY